MKLAMHPAGRLRAASAAMCRSTSSSPIVLDRPWIGPSSRAEAGTSRNRASTEGAPIVASMAPRSSSVCGR
jgi:hypothetical protein